MAEGLRLLRGVHPGESGACIDCSLGFFSTLLLLLILNTPVASSQSDQPDVVFIHANIWTVDKSMPAAQAVAVKDGKIVAIGTDEEVKGLVGKGTKVVDINGKLMLPGFIDNHTHFMSGG